MLLGIEIGGTKLQLVLGNREGQIIRRKRFVVDKARGGEGIREQISEGIPALLANDELVAVGVGFGGPVDFRTGTVCRSHQIEGWGKFSLGEWLSNLTGVPVLVENDANTACLGEAALGAGKGKDPVFYVTLGSGVGGGLVVQGWIYHGFVPGEAEIGHVRLDRAGTIVEDRCSGWAVDRKIRQEVERQPQGVLAQLCVGMDGGEARCLTTALKAGDRVAQRILDETAEDLAFGLSHVTHLCHPETIILGGGLSLIGEPLRASVETALKGFVMDAFQPGPAVLLSALGEDAVPMGALQVAIQFA
jgi:glucokinase